MDKKMQFRVERLLSYIIVWLISSIMLMLLWNWIMPQLIGAGTLDYFKACGLYLICGSLFNRAHIQEKQ